MFNSFPRSSHCVWCKGWKILESFFYFYLYLLWVCCRAVVLCCWAAEAVAWVAGWCGGYRVGWRVWLGPLNNWQTQTRPSHRRWASRTNDLSPPSWCVKALACESYSQADCSVPVFYTPDLRRPPQPPIRCCLHLQPPAHLEDTQMTSKVKETIRISSWMQNNIVGVKHGILDKHDWPMMLFFLFKFFF